ncbi:hypothetical protein [Vibrio metoecus]|uniref:Uncharacterized protein n=1 Tax=Vibrio metoecus TaxID=1481663 RepID=A0A271VRS1_VIBMT|nr:hypothetical protein [Vibrio metoecus]KQB09809.1 hypothetical protein XV94_07225 [Vibrio metoecus]PAR20840.1 hypothetical protein CGU03_09860 [Vibrio metoecus]PAR23591.1 hypothetical protein CGU02_13355 [Vibrio metoecus]
MGKSLKAKKYFSVEAAAVYLSSVLEEQVSVADVYELVLEGNLTISARLINQAYAVKGKMVQQRERSLFLYEEEVPEFEKRIHVINGIWDLAMIGMEMHQVKALYQKELNGPAPMIAELNGFYLEKEGSLYRLLNALPLSGSEDHRAALEARLNSLLKTKGYTIQDVFLEGNFDVMDSLDDVELEEFMALSDAVTLENAEDELPEYHALETPQFQFVFRTDELKRFLDSLNDEPTRVNDETIHPRRRDSYLVVIAALCKQQGIDPKTRGVCSSIELMVQQLGANLSQDTIKSILDEVADAIERKQI